MSVLSCILQILLEISSRFIFFCNCIYIYIYIYKTLIANCLPYKWRTKQVKKNIYYRAIQIKTT